MGQNYTAYRGPSKRDVQCSTTPKMTICQTYGLRQIWRDRVGRDMPQRDFVRRLLSAMGNEHSGELIPGNVAI